ncbi:MAG: ADP-ribose pyrophosphatase [Chloroflexi bacterium HGW-Chloroflexi-5]|jgi:8-oxo-dGTP pyrophosphatase MutT (NUDIX family)|nr:MAG: ADP-ribose pyrophosphatase [Chloroflexi bacterium HGW-Chloroflexi-5]
MSYLLELRKLVGHQPLIMVGATMLLINQQKELLMMKRTDNLFWGLPGGSLELGESLEECVKRETFEEVGITVDHMKLFGVYSGKEMHYTYPNGDEVYIVSAVFLSEIDHECIQLNLDEHSTYRFFKLNEIPDKVSPPIKPVLLDLINKYMK